MVSVKSNIKKAKPSLPSVFSSGGVPKFNDIVPDLFNIAVLILFQLEDVCEKQNIK